MVPFWERVCRTEDTLRRSKPWAGLRTECLMKARPWPTVNAVAILMETPLSFRKIPSHEALYPQRSSSSLFEENVGRARTKCRW